MRSFSIVLLLAVDLCSRSIAVAAVVASDTAAAAAYTAEVDGAWKGENPTAGENLPGTDNGGAGFHPWNFAGGYHYPEVSPYGRLNHFIDGVDFPHSSFNSLGAPAFGLTNSNLAYGGSTSRATRVFSSTLEVGSSVTIDFDNPLLQPFAQFAAAGFGIRLNSGGGPISQSGVSERLGFFTTSGFNGDNWSTSDSSGFTNLGLSPAQTAGGAKFVFTLTGSEAYELQILPLLGGTPLVSRVGMLKSPGSGPIDSIEVVMFENGSGNGVPGAGGVATGEREFFFNNLSVSTPGQSADFNLDGVVDGSDFLIWQRQFTTAGPNADGNLDGLVDGQDLTLWKAAFEASTNSISTVVPEPTGIWHSVVGLLAFALLTFHEGCAPDNGS